MFLKVNLWVDGNLADVDVFVRWLQEQACSAVKADEKLGAVGVKTIELDLMLCFKPYEEVKGD